MYRVSKAMAIHRGTIVNFMGATYKGANIRTIMLICRGLGITVKEFFDDPMFESDELDID